MPVMVGGMELSDFVLKQIKEARASERERCANICKEVQKDSGRHEAFARRVGDHDGAKRASANASCASRIAERILNQKD